ncbi:MAG: OB-fold nucleic acid binding domain-containing protein, partial [Acidimicrobiaceae bacterium]|nr:OB-fold nucleic acid binding domain-containing protein [Acidimicrobiaceae bacterium]
VIQYVYDRYGRGCASLVANVITYRPRSAVRDMGKALGASTGQLDAWAKQIEAWSPLTPEGSVPAASRKKSGPWSHDGAGHDAVVNTNGAGRTGGAAEHDIPAPVTDLAAEVLHFPRHLGIHPGGMVLCDRPVSEVCPVEWATMADRSILQWDKEDCAAAGLVKFDLLGLGMLSAIHATIDHIDRFYGVEIDLATIPQEDAVYEMLCRADSIGVFQVESRAQMATLPRLQPREFYDLVIEVALIRPGPIQGGSVHPYLRRRKGVEPATPLHPKVATTLEKTLGVPLFQEQLMQMAIDVAGFTPAESDQLRQAMGSKRSHDRIEKLKVRLYEGMAGNGITGEVADHIYEKLQAFANFGFPESHAVSFAYLVYASAWLKLHYPAAFCAGLLDSQPMGFWSPQTLVSDARRHGVCVLGPDINASDAGSRLDTLDSEEVLRLGLSSVRHVGADLAEGIAAERAVGVPYRDIEDVVRRTGINAAQAEALATAGAFGCFGLSRRAALWAAGALAQAGATRLPGLVTGVEAPPLPDMNPTEKNRADLWSTGLSPDSYPTELIRAELDAAGVVVAADLMTVPADRPVRVGGIVTHRQRPSTAKGVIFINLEDETGLVNVICPPPVWARYRRVARSEPAVVVDGRLERVDGVVNVLAQRISALPLESSLLRSRDFR